ncbi:AMP-binding protein [Streptomyces sp. NPDC007205]|uniref:AMP-dependent synthetase/ligase n=1 Tax=Streptomyces sp. NPDC007205 TaxID=3154316 RepID=UPI0033EBA5ED
MNHRGGSAERETATAVGTDAGVEPRVGNGAGATAGGWQTLAHLSRWNARHWPQAPAMRWRDPDGGWRAQTYAEAWQATQETARGLLALGLRPGDRVAVLSRLRPEWTTTLHAAAATGLVVVSLLPTTVPEEISHVLGDCEASVVVCEDAAQLAKVRTAWPRLPTLRQAVVLDDPQEGDAVLRAEVLPQGEAAVSQAGAAAMHAAPDQGIRRAMTLARLRELGRRAVSAQELQTYADAVGAEDLLAIIYTSGTTGPKKGCALTHGNYVSVLRAHPQPPPTPDAGPAHTNGTLLVVTGPHTIAMLMQILSWWSRYTLAYPGGGPDHVVRDVQDVRPEILPLVPLALEKLYSAVLASFAPQDQPEIRRAALTGLAVRQKLARGECVPARLRNWFEDMDQTVFQAVREHFGGRLRRMTVSGAAVSQDILAFLLGCGVPVVECYGMTETAAAATSNHPHDYRLGTVGKPLPGIEVAIADDGEVLIRGANVFAGYWGYDEGRFGAIRDGWLHTGDLGVIDSDGYVSLTGRKKELIQLSNGMAVTPHPLERELRTSPLISNAVAYGEGKPHLVVLLTLDEDGARQWAAVRGLPADVPSLARTSQLRRELGHVLEAANARLQEYYRAQAFTVLDRDLSLDEGELTVSLKVARPVVLARFHDLLESLYA